MHQTILIVFLLVSCHNLPARVLSDTVVDTSDDTSSGSASADSSGYARSDDSGSSSSSQDTTTPRPAKGSLLQRADGVADYLASIHRTGLKMTVDSVNEGTKKNNQNSFEDANIKINNRNTSDFTRTGQVQTFEGPGFKLRTALLTENTGGKIKTSVITSQDTEKNYTKSKDRVTQFVGTLDTDEFSSGALLTDHSNRAVSGSVRTMADGNRDSRLRKQTTDEIKRGSFLKTANLTINARFQSNTFSDRQRQVSDIVLGDANGNSSGAAASSQSGSAAASIGDAEDDS